MSSKLVFYSKILMTRIFLTLILVCKRPIIDFGDCPGQCTLAEDNRYATLFAFSSCFTSLTFSCTKRTAI
jgi:hypothetical protein